MTDPGGLWLRPIDERVTRFLCSTVHLDGTFANHAWQRLLSPGRQGQAPEAEIDPIALGRHTMLSLRRRRARDQRLGVLLLIAVVMAVLLFYAGARDRFTMGEVAVLLTILPIIGWMIALFIVFDHYSKVRRSAIDVFSATYGNARFAAPALDAECEERLEQVHWSNAIIYNRNPPFVGAGATLDSWRVNLYTNPSRDGRRQSPPGGGAYIGPSEINEWLMEQVPQVLNQDRVRVRVERRLYVDGATATAVPGLIPDDQGEHVATRPATRVSEELLDQYTEEPTRTARTYCAFVDNSGNGDVVVTVLVRAEMVGDTLYVEGRSHVLLPVQAGFKDVYWVSQRPDQRTLPVLRTALPRTTGLWLESPIRLFRLYYGDWKDMRALREEGRRLERGQPVNYGTDYSLREDAALPTDGGFFGAMDEVMYFRAITQQIFESLADLLRMHGVESLDLEKQRNLHAEDVFNVEGLRNSSPHGTGNLAH